jgi:DNA-binding CsgD family transcriptional regulator
VPELTRREGQVLDRICRGMSNKSIANELGVSEQAVKAHITRLFLKHGVENRAGLVAAVVGGAARDSVQRERDMRADQLERQIGMLTTRNDELQRANDQLRGTPARIAAAATAAD